MWKNCEPKILLNNLDKMQLFGLFSGFWEHLRKIRPAGFGDVRAKNSTRAFGLGLWPDPSLVFGDLFWLFFDASRFDDFFWLNANFNIFCDFIWLHQNDKKSVSSISLICRAANRDELRPKTSTIWQKCRMRVRTFLDNLEATEVTLSLNYFWRIWRLVLASDLIFLCDFVISSCFSGLVWPSDYRFFVALPQYRRLLSWPFWRAEMTWSSWRAYLRLPLIYVHHPVSCKLNAITYLFWFPFTFSAMFQVS